MDSSTQDADELKMPDSETHSSQEQQKTKWFKNKKIILVLTGVLVLLVAGSVYFVLGGRESEPMTPSKNTKAPANEEQPAANEPVPKIYKAEGLPGLSFKAPSKWSLVRQASSSEYTLYSPDAVIDFAGFGGVNKGASIQVRALTKDAALEATKERAVDAYISSNGTPESRSKLKYFKNKQGVDMVAYPHSHEGCYLIVMFVGELSPYVVQIQTSGGCPENSLLEADAGIKAFIDSIALGDKSVVESEVYVNSGSEKGNETQEIHAGTLEFGFTRTSDEHSGLGLFQPIVVPKVKSDGTFDKLVIGDSSQLMASQYSCQGCGFVLDTYDSSITFTAKKLSVTGFQELAPNIYGKAETVQSIQEGASATKYTYLKTFAQGTFTITSTVEQHKNGDAPHSLTLPAFMQTIESLRLL